MPTGIMCVHNHSNNNAFRALLRIYNHCCSLLFLQPEDEVTYDMMTKYDLDYRCHYVVYNAGTRVLYLYPDVRHVDSH